MLTKLRNLLVKDMEPDLLREINYASAGAGKTQREWVIEVLARKVGYELVPSSNLDGGKDRQPPVRDRRVGESLRAETSANNSIESKESRTSKEPAKTAKVRNRRSSLRMSDITRTTEQVMGEVSEKLVPVVESKAVGHDTASCRIYKCGMCAAKKVQA